MPAHQKRDRLARNLGRPLKERVRGDRIEQLDRVRAVERPAFLVVPIVAEHFDASPIELVPVSVERRGHVALHAVQEIVGQHFHAPEIEERHAPVSQEPVIARMRIGVENAVAQHRSEHELPNRHPGLVARLLRGSLAEFFVGLTPDELGREHTTGRQRVIDVWDHNAGDVMIHPAKCIGHRGLARVVELVQEDVLDVFEGLLGVVLAQHRR